MHVGQVKIIYTMEICKTTFCELVFKHVPEYIGFLGSIRLLLQHSFSNCAALKAFHTLAFPLCLHGPPLSCIFTSLPHFPLGLCLGSGDTCSEPGYLQPQPLPRVDWKLR